MEELIKRVKQGEKRAIREFYYRYEGVVRKYLLAKLPREEVEEVLQDVFLGAMDSISLFRGEAKIKSWLLAIARHEVADFYRKKKARELVKMTVRLWEGAAKTRQTPEFFYKRQEIKEKLAKTLQKLNKRYQQVLFWRYEMRMSVKEVAEKMNLSFKATESLLYRARMAFIEAYEKD